MNTSFEPPETETRDTEAIRWWTKEVLVPLAVAAIAASASIVVGVLAVLFVP